MKYLNMINYKISKRVKSISLKSRIMQVREVIKPHQFYETMTQLLQGFHKLFADM